MQAVQLVLSIVQQRQRLFIPYNRMAILIFIERIELLMSKENCEPPAAFIVIYTHKHAHIRLGDSPMGIQLPLSGKYTCEKSGWFAWKWLHHRSHISRGKVHGGHVSVLLFNSIFFSCFLIQFVSDYVQYEWCILIYVCGLDAWRKMGDDFFFFVYCCLLRWTIIYLFTHMWRVAVLSDGWMDTKKREHGPPTTWTATIQYVMNRLLKCHFNACTSKSPSHWRRDRDRKRRKNIQYTHRTHTHTRYVHTKTARRLWARAKRKNSLTLSHTRRKWNTLHIQT